MSFFALVTAISGAIASAAPTLWLVACATTHSEQRFANGIHSAAHSSEQVWGAPAAQPASPQQTELI